MNNSVSGKIKMFSGFELNELFLVESFVFSHSIRNQIVIPREHNLLNKSFLVRVVRLFNVSPNVMKAFIEINFFANYKLWRSRHLTHIFSHAFHWE